MYYVSARLAPGLGSKWHNLMDGHYSMTCSCDRRAHFDNHFNDNNRRDDKSSPDKAADSKRFDRPSGARDRRRPGQRPMGDRQRDGKSRDNRFSYAKLNSRLFDDRQEVPEFKMIEATSRVEPVFSSHKYNELALHPYLVKCLSDRLSIEETTSVQQDSIPALMSGSDALIKSMTGSGKTLAFAVPVVQDLQAIEPHIQRSDGIYALVIVPTRELALQCYENFSVLCQSFKRLVTGYLCGGEKKKSEKARIRKGINILVTTPGRLLDHMQSTGNLHLNRVKWFIIDEADRLLEAGFEESVKKVMDHLYHVCPTRPQTVLLSATLSPGVERLAGMSLTNPRIIDISSDQDLSSYVLPEHLKQHFIIVAPKLRLITLSALLMDKCSVNESKALVFMSSQDVVDFHFMIFNNVFNRLLDKSEQKTINFYQLHGNMDQSKRRQVFKDFREARNGVLFCTDVAARGLDLPQVDWIVQFTCAPTPEDFVHRVGRTARIGNTGNAVQFVLTTETKFLELMQKDLNINISEINLKECLKTLMLMRFNRKVFTEEEYATELQTCFETALTRDEDLMALAKRAYLSYIRSYATYPKAVTEALPFKSLHLGHLAKSFALQESPKALGAYGFRLKQQSIDLQQKYNMYNKKVKHNFERTGGADGFQPDGDYQSSGGAADGEPAHKRPKYRQMPTEMRTSEYGGQLVTKPMTKKRSKKR
ncbi:unnamed protein product [Medioppia subpectinata]|uniref:ATP-dependent RNA helicase n=1 Tax=Medioppia subpectinata TaxID=1979941 RepID=A0A7R9KBH0_9ACAR|nr:unnamed protein product [Medioppia subpectinata]CAG2100233.1 unnamed protein product [Medioppia subpectinata]